jgi:NADH:ubiquinone oxidoreductase subunit F (NADH-binding)
MNSWATTKRTERAGVASVIDSFYHLPVGGIGQASCRGLACFVARHLNLPRWQQACAGDANVYCLGKCHAAPAATSDEQRPALEVHSAQGVVLGRILEGASRAFSEYVRVGGYQAIQMALKQPPEELIRQIESSGLRGRGGAGFPTGKKWRAVFGQRSAEKFVVANADEGDPGAYIDRFIMEDDPHCLIEGLLIAGYAGGAGKAYIYVRNEYPQAYEVLKKALSEARHEGLLGQRICESPFCFEIELVKGKGSYICGEETALLNSIEGKRPEVRARPPYPTEFGLFGKPTLVNNVETLTSVPWIVSQGAEAYRKLGFSSSRGTKVISLNSLFRRPGLYEIEFGIPVRRIVEDLGGGLKSGSIRGVIIGGPLAGVIPPQLFDTPFGFEELHAIGASVGHGGIVAFDEHTSIAELIHHVFQFGSFESCGKCTPCRLGSRRIEEIFAQVLKTRSGSARDRIEWREILSALSMTSLCGLGTGLGEFAESILRYYSKELEACFT